MKYPNKKKCKYKKISCPKCRCKSIKKNGKRSTKHRGLIQRYKCKKCGYRFTKDNGFFRMRNAPKKITLCLDLFFRGMSTRQIQEHLQAFYPKNSSWVSIWSWIVKYSKMISGFTDRLNIQSGKELQVDEMEYKTKGKTSWFIDVIDTKTRFMVSSNYVRQRGISELKDIVKKSKEKTKNKVKIVTTDGLMAYQKMIRKVFGYNRHTHSWNIKHNIVNASKGEGFNIMVERLHNSIRQRTKTFSGFGSLEGANSIMKGFEAYYNFIRKHQTLKRTPAEIAIPNFKLREPNKWLELIHLTKNSN